MQLAVHLREPMAMADLHAQLDSLGPKPGPAGWPGACQQLYFGDEFCIHRLPKPSEFEALIRMAAAAGWKLTLLTPPLTDEGLALCGPLLDRLCEHDPRAEVVANDWGVLFFLKQAYPTFQLAVGRLLNKGFKDPRLAKSAPVNRDSGDPYDLFSQSTFDGSDLRRKLKEWGVARQEKDLFPYAALPEMRTSSQAAAFYFPFGAITTGRVCWLASFSGGAQSQLSISRTCGRPCRRVSARLRHNGLKLGLFQSGNTVFYRYPQPMLSDLLTKSAHQDVRLVYQGLAIQSP